MWHNLRGFTLLELIVVLVIAASTIAIVAPRFTGGVDAINSQKQARQLVTMLRRARSIALADGLEIKLVINEQADGYQLQPLAEKVVLPPGYLLQISAPEETEQEPLTEPSAIIFYPDGSSSGGQLQLARESDESEDVETLGITVTVDWLTGRVVLDNDKEAPSG